MASKRSGKLDVAVFVVSAVVLAFLYGYGSHVFGWFPDGFLRKAWDQARLVYLHPSSVILRPRVYGGSGAEVRDRAAVQPGLTLVTSEFETDRGRWLPGLRLLDTDGRVLHAWTVDPDTMVAGTDSLRGSPRDARSRSIHGSDLLPDGDVVFNLEYVGTFRLDACGRIRWRVLAGDHHSVAPADDGSFWTPGSTDLRPPHHPFPEGPFYRDLLVHISRDGRVLDRIDLVDLLYRNGLQDYLLKSPRSVYPDPTHLNDIEPLPDSLADAFPEFGAGDLLVSVRNLNLVMVVDPGTRRVLWHTSDPFLLQHDPDFMRDGRIGAFDNRNDGTRRGTRLGGTRIVAVQPGSGVQDTLYPKTVSDTFYSDIMGKWQQLANGNLLLTEARAGRVLEVTPAGRTVWQWLAPPHDSTHIFEVGEGTRYDLDPAAVTRWPCSPDHRSDQDRR